MTKKPRSSSGQPSNGPAFRKRAAGRNPSRPSRQRNAAGSTTILITGGAGFIGTNVADHFLSSGHRVLLYDNLSRPGVERNVAWLRARHGNKVQI